MSISHFVLSSSFNNAAPFHLFSPSLKKMRHLAHILLCSGRMQGGAGSNLIFSGYSVKAAQKEGFLKSRLSPICEVRWGVTEAGRTFQQDEG